MNIGNYKLSNLSAENVEATINSGDCCLIEAGLTSDGLFSISECHDVNICGTFMRGKCIAYDGLPTIPLRDIHEYEIFYLCKKSEKKELWDALIKHFNK